MKRLLAAALLLAAPVVSPVGAQDLKMAFDSEWTSIDPHFHSFPQNLSVSAHIFETLPQLSTEARPLGPDLWEFRLRRGVRFHDGRELTAADVAASLTRIPKVPNSPGPVTTFIRPIGSWEIPDPHTIRLKTKEPSPVLLELLDNVFIVPASVAEASTEDFNTGRAAIGTGPYRFTGWKRGEGVQLERNEAYWGDKPAWARVEIRVISNPAAREAALLSKAVDFIQSPSTGSLERLQREPGLALHKATSTRITYLQFSQGAEALPDLKGSTGGRNPFADARVRRAVSMAIPREAIAARIMDGLSVPAAQVVPPGDLGFSPEVPLERHDLDAARKLLAETGWDKGFEVALSTPNDRNINGVKIAEAIAAQLTRIGIKTAVNAVPLNVYLSEWRKGRYSFYMHGAGPPPATLLLAPQLAGSKVPERALGVSNESGYSNPRLDQILETAQAELDEGKRRTLLWQGARIIREETAVVPLHHEIVVWASRAGLAYQGRGDARTHAMEVRPKGS